MIKLLISLSMLFVASSADANEFMTKETEFAKSAFGALYSLPRPANDIDASYGYFSNGAAFAEFVKTTRATPYAGIASATAQSVSYDFPGTDDAFEVRSDFDAGTAGIRFKATQHITVGVATLENCFAVFAVVRRVPFYLPGVGTGFSLDRIETKPLPVDACATHQ
jgi:hypothetical protein